MSNLKPEQLPSLIRSGKLDRVYLFDGPELWLKEKLFNQILESTLERDQKDLNFDRFDGHNASPAAIVNSLQSLPFLAPKRLLLVQSTEEFSSTDSKIIAEALDNIPETSLIIFYYQGKASLRDPIPAQIQSQGQIITFWTPFDNQLPSWLVRESRERGKTLDFNAARLLTESCEGLQQISDELDKLILFIGKKTRISLDDLYAHGLPDGMGIFKDLEESIWKRNLSNAMRQVTLMSETGIRAESIFPLFERIMRQLVLGHVLVREKGCPRANVYTTLGLRGKIKQGLFDNGFSQYSELESREGIRHIIQAHWDLKTGTLNSELVLVTLITNLMKRKLSSGLVFS